jgi:hypothetical protein
MPSGEHLIYRAERNRGWQSLLLTLLVDAVILVAVLGLFNFLDRTVVHSFINPNHVIDRAEFMVLNLFLGIVPILTVLAMVQDFLFTFFIHLDLTSKHISGQVPGVLWLKEVNIPIEQVALMKMAAGHLVIQEFGGRKTLIRGLPGMQNLLAAYRRLRFEDTDGANELFDSLPDAFTFKKVNL